MPVSRTRRPQGGNFGNEYGSSFSRRYSSNNDNSRDLAGKFREHVYNVNNDETIYVPSLKKRKFSASGWENSGRYHWQPVQIGDAPSTSNSLFLVPKRADTSAYTHTSHKRDHSKLEDDVIFMSRDEIERCSPSRKDGIDSVRETHLRYSYCAFLQNLGMRLDLPQTTIGTAMVLCHRFFVRRSHACHDRFLIATAALFLAAKSEETPRPLNNVLRASCEICHKQDLTFFSYLLPVDWFEQYRERVTEAEQMILTTLDFELNVHHPYVPLTSVLNKLGLSQSVLVNLALNLVSEGVLGLGSARPDFMQNIYELVLQGSPDSVGLCWVGCASRSDPTFCPSRFLTPYSTKLVKFEGQLAYLPKKTSLAVDWLEVRRLKEIGAKNIIDLRSL